MPLYRLAKRLDAGLLADLRRLVVVRRGLPVMRAAAVAGAWVWGWTLGLMLIGVWHG